MVSPVTVLLPTAYFPPVSYFIHINRCESALIEQMETFPKQTYRNRCEIMTSAGKLNLVVPVTKPNGNHTLTKDIEICYREPWQQHHWKSIQTAYRSAPYFNYYADIIQPLFELKETSLIANNRIIITLLTKIIGLGSKLEFTQDYFRQPVDLIDLRSAISPKKKNEGMSFHEYPQVFSHKFGFVKDLCVLDLIFNLGPEAKKYLLKIGDERLIKLS